jgi:hypothetical protein
VETIADIHDLTYGLPDQRAGLCEAAGDPWAEADQIVALAADLQALVEAGLIEIRVDDTEEAHCELTEFGKTVAPATNLMHKNQEEAP